MMQILVLKFLVLATHVFLSFICRVNIAEVELLKEIMSQFEDILMCLRIIPLQMSMRRLDIHIPEAKKFNLSWWNCIYECTYVQIFWFWIANMNLRLREDNQNKGLCNEKGYDMAQRNTNILTKIEKSKSTHGTEQEWPVWRQKSQETVMLCS